MRYLFLLLLMILVLLPLAFADLQITENDLGYTEVGYFKIDLNNDGVLETLKIIQPHPISTNLPDSVWGDDTGVIIKILDEKSEVVYVDEVCRSQPVENITIENRDDDPYVEVIISIRQTKDYNARTYIYGWEEESYRLKATLDVKRHKVDLDNDNEEEIVTYEQRFDMPEDMIPIPIEAEVAVFESNGDKAGSSSMPDHVGELEFVSLNKDGFKQIVARSLGGAHYTNIAIYGYKDSRLYKIFENGSACPIETNFDTDKPFIKVGRANWSQEGWSYASEEPLWQTYVWNGEEFTYNVELSTISEIRQEEEASRYVGKIESLLEKQ